MAGLCWVMSLPGKPGFGCQGPPGMAGMVVFCIEKNPVRGVSSEPTGGNAGVAR